ESEGAKSSQLSSEKGKAEREIKDIHEQAARKAKQLDEIEDVVELIQGLEVKDLISDELMYRELKDRFGEYFQGGMGAEAIKELLVNLNIKEEIERLRTTIREGKGQKRARAIKRLKVATCFVGTKNSPQGMVL